VDRHQLAESLRSFNRYYTETIGALDERQEGTEVNLAQSRTLFTIRALGAPKVSQLAAAMQLDLAYTSRLLGTLEDGGLVGRTTADDDRRQRIVSLTPGGERLLADIERRSNDRMLAVVAHLDDDGIGQLLAAMRQIRHLLTPERTDDDRLP
jgi:DNA-binding MarR family transcriptional regulator